MNKKQIAVLVATVIVSIILVLVIMFNIKTYDIMYDTKGGTFVASERVKIFKQATRPLDPTKEGYTFDNWYYEDGIFDFSTKITQNMIIEARWIEGSPVEGTFIVSFNSNGGSSIASVRSNLDGTVTRPKDPEREGYTFVAWQYNGEDFDFSTKITSNMTLVAKWEEGEGNNTDKPSVPAQKVTVSPTSISMYVGNTRKIAVALAPAEAVNRKMYWTSSNTRVATVDSYGTVRAVGVGSAVITVTVDGVKATIAVTVTQAPTVPVNPDQPKPEEPKPDEPTPEVPETYSIEYEAIPSSAMGEVYIKIKSSKRGFVAGVIQITTQNGTVTTENVSASGYKMPRSIIQNVVVVSTN